MFTLGFRLFGLFSLLALIGAIVYGISTGDASGKDYFGIIDTETIKGVFSLGWQGGVGDHLGYVILIFLAFASLGLGIILVVFRDANAREIAKLEGVEVAPNPESVANRNFWPVVVAVGAAIALVGLAAGTAIFIIGLVLSAISILQWAIFAWSERLTGDPETNRQIRNRIMAPIEIPVLGAAIIAILAIGASRVFLTVSELNAVWVGTGIALIIFLGAIFLAMKPRISQSFITIILVVAAIGIIAAGIASAVIGSREVHHADPKVEVIDIKE